VNDRLAGEAVPPESFVQGLRSGERGCLGWLRGRAVSRAAGRFSAWAWAWIEDDFVADLLTQLTVTTGRPGFVLRGPAAAYVDIAVDNLCRHYFRRIARLRAQEPIGAEPPQPGPRFATVERICAALDLRRALADTSPACRRLLTFKYLEGLSLEEIGRQEGIGAGVVQSRLHACREGLRRRFRPGATTEPAGGDS
jgi:DNA-directed RNA polymerase specialized sigma24 family protein